MMAGSLRNISCFDLGIWNNFPIHRRCLYPKYIAEKSPLSFLIFKILFLIISLLICPAMPMYVINIVPLGKDGCVFGFFLLSVFLIISLCGDNNPYRIPSLLQTSVP